MSDSNATLEAAAEGVSSSEGGAGVRMSGDDDVDDVDEGDVVEETERDSGSGSAVSVTNEESRSEGRPGSQRYLE